MERKLKESIIFPTLETLKQVGPAMIGTMVFSAAYALRRIVVAIPTAFGSRHFREKKVSFCGVLLGKHYVIHLLGHHRLPEQCYSC